MIYWCVEHGGFWTKTSTTRKVVTAPARLCPDCVAYGKWKAENKK